MITKLRRNEAGIALTSVVIVALVMMTLVGGTVAFAVNSQDLSARDQGWNAALAAAEAGLDDYLYRLNREDAYWACNETSPCGNNAFTGWVPVPGDAGNTDGKFRYRVDTSSFASDGTIKIASTGLVRNSTRTVYSILRRKSFLDYLYFTDYETLDPGAYSSSSDQSWANANCREYRYEGRDSDCVAIHFFTHDVVNGPLHTNDALLISSDETDKPKFLGPTTSSYPDPDPVPGGWHRWYDGRYSTPTPTGTQSDPYFERPGDPAYEGILEIPPSNTAIKTKADSTPGATGCLYSGPTEIVLNSTGTMNVRSPQTPNTTPRYTQCVGTGKSLPANGVIYVQKNSLTSGSYRCSLWNNSGSTSALKRNHPFREPNSGAFIPSNDVTQYGNPPTSPPTGGKCDGDAFVEGTLRGRLTIAAENNIVITDDIRYQGGTAGTDLLGLVANNYVEVFHPVSSGGSNLVSGLNNLTIQAAILSVAHSFRVQNYNEGSSLGSLTVDGVIAQKFRGPVGTFSQATGNSVNGYLKDYEYDNRLRFMAPPYFLDPVQAAWIVRDWAEVQPCYPSSTGAVRTTPTAYPCNADTPQV